MKTELVTYQDLVEHLLDMFDNERAGRPLRMARRAAREAMRELSESHPWAYYISSYLFKTEASQTTGTITYDNATYEVTLSGATFPSTARYYRIIINDVHYPIASRIDSTTVQLFANQNPGSSITDATSYTLYRAAYPLPVDCVSMSTLYDIEHTREIPLLYPNDVEAMARSIYDTPQDPWYATVRADGEYLNSLSIVFAPPPSSSRSYSFLYQRKPRELKTELYSTGTVSGTSGSTTVTITSGTFSSDHRGAILRLSSTSTAPTSEVGGLDGTDNPYSEQLVITDVASNGSSVTVSPALSSTYSSVGFTVSDPVDVELEAMYQAVTRLAEAMFSRMTKRDLKHVTEREAAARVAVTLAKERDTRADFDRGVTWYDPFSYVTITDDV